MEAKLSWRNRMAVVFIALAVFAASAAADVRMESTSLDPSHIEAGSEVSVYVKVYRAPEKSDVYSGTERSGSIGVIKDDPTLFYRAQLLPKGEASKQYVIILDGDKKIGHLFYGESWTTPFTIRLRADAPAADYPLEYRLVETDSDYKTETAVKSYEIALPVEGIVKFDISSDSSLPLGGTAALELSLTNVGGGSARQVSVEFNASSPFTVLSSSEAYAGDMAGVSTRKLSYTVLVSSSAKPGAYDIPVLVRYVNSTGGEVTIRRVIGVEVSGEPDISVMLNKADALKSGASGTVTLDVINKGFIDAKFLVISLVPSESYSVLEPSRVYVGNLASDDLESQDFEVTVSDSAAEGALPLRVVVEYQNENSNKVRRLESTVSVDVLSSGDYAKTLKANGNGSSVLSTLLLIPVLVVAYLVLWLVVKFVGVATGYLNKKLFKRGGG